jgi:hypothetical protein
VELEEDRETPVVTTPRIHLIQFCTVGPVDQVDIELITFRAIVSGSKASDLRKERVNPGEGGLQHNICLS